MEVPTNQSPSKIRMRRTGVKSSGIGMELEREVILGKVTRYNRGSRQVFQL